MIRAFALLWLVLGSANASEAPKDGVVDLGQGAEAWESRLEQGKQEYALGRPEAALTLFDRIPEEKLQGEPRAQLLYWRAQSRLVLKGFQRAQDDFEGFLRLFPDHALADSARLAVADCDAALKNEDAALTGYQKLFQAPASSVAPQAFLQAASLHLRAGRKEEARQLLQKLVIEYPDSLESNRAKDELRAMPAATPPTPTPDIALKAAFCIQVGAYSRSLGALALLKKLRKKGYAVRVDKQVIRDNVFHLVQIGRYKSRQEAQKAADRIKAKEQLPVRVVEIKTP